MYKLYASKLHPDKHNGDPFFDDLFKNINKAYNDIINHVPSGRRSYTAGVYGMNDLQQENAALRQRVDELQSQLRNQIMMQAELNTLRASLSEAKKDAEKYQQLSVTYLNRSQKAITWCVAFAIGWIILLII